MEKSQIQKLTNEELVEEVGKRVIGTGSGLESQHAQAELIRRQIDSTNKMSEETAKYSKTLIDLTVILFAVAFAQLVVSVMAAPISWWGKIGLALVSAFFIIYIIKSLMEVKRDNKK